MMIRRDLQMTAVVALTVAALAGVLAALVSQVGRPYPGFFFSADYRVFPVSPESRAAGLGYGDRIITVDGGSPVNLMARVDERAAGRRGAGAPPSEGSGSRDERAAGRRGAGAPPSEGSGSRDERAAGRRGAGAPP